MVSSFGRGTGVLRVIMISYKGDDISRQQVTARLGFFPNNAFKALTDRQTTSNSKTTLCTVVHKAVKTLDFCIFPQI